MLNEAQKLVAAAYGNGDYAHVRSLDECRDCGDGLFTFLMIELDDKEGCDSMWEAARRVDMAQRQLDEVISALEASGGE